MLLVDSTNISSSKDIGLHEYEIQKNIEEEVSNSKSDLFITLFPSNIERLKTIIEACNKHNRPCHLCGFSTEVGYSPWQRSGHPTAYTAIKLSTREKRCSLLSGSQADFKGCVQKSIYRK